MPDRPKHSAAREKTITGALQKLVKRVTSFQRSLVTKVVDYFQDKFKVKDNKITVDPSNFSAVNALRDLYEEWNEPAKKSILKLVIDNLVDLHSNNVDYFGELADYDIKNDSEKVFRDMMKRLGYDREKKILTRGGYLDAVLNSDDPVLRLKVLALRAIIAGQSLTDFKKSIDILARGDANTPGLLEKHYGTHLYDVFQQYDREVGRLLATKLGLKYAIYQGGLIKTSRPFCIVRNDKVFTVDEIALFGTPKDKYGGYSDKSTGDFQGKPDVYNPFLDLGGYNCRHQLDYISNEIGAILRERQDEANEKEKSDVQEIEEIKEEIEEIGPLDVIRKIYADSIEEIDLENIGSHWTSNEDVLKKAGVFGYTQAGGSVEYRIYATVDSSQIDQSATLFSNERYPNENEVVLYPNTDIHIVIWNRETGEDEYEGDANTGNRIEQWVENFHNGITD